jgi:cell division protein ZapA
MKSGDGGAEVLIFGERYTLRSEDGPDHLNRVAEYVDRKFHEVAQAAQSLAPSKVAVLASLNIADELVKRDEAARRFEGEVLARIEEISQLLHREGAVEEAAPGGPVPAGGSK